ncbi:MAG: hypothetical protein P4L43_00265 [Syntrophobacteraceae bacterium]|nr:hypothetical protein [Syntrophobacteraceae bacterium]
MKYSGITDRNCRWVTFYSHQVQVVCFPRGNTTPQGVSSDEESPAPEH